MDISLLLRAAAALILVLGLIGLAAWFVRRFGWSGVRAGAVKTANRRLAVREALTLDARHRLVLIQRDDTEHLILLGMDGSRIVESDIAAKARESSA